MRIGQSSSIGGGENPFQHTVQQGDTLDSIAGQYGVTKHALLENNTHVTGEQLQPGQVLQIPQSTAPPVASSQSTDTIEYKEGKVLTDLFQEPSNEYVPSELLGAAPPYVPVGPVVGPIVGPVVDPVVGGDNIEASEVEKGAEVRQVKLSADQFQINEEGNLVINNPDLIDFFKTLTESAPEGQDFTLGIMKMKPPEE
jgi:hypothetical protein